MDVKQESLSIKSETITGIFQDSTCRICLFRHEENSVLSGPENTLAECISKHLSIQLGSKDDFPIWICKFCQESLLSFHNFHSKVSQIQESLLNLVAALKETPCNLDETLDAELDAIDLTVGFGRGKPNQLPALRSTRSRTKRERDIIDNKDQTVDLSKKKKRKKGNGSKEIVNKQGNRPCKSSGDVLNNLCTSESNTVSNANESEEVTEIALKPEKRTLPKDDDLSSLEDQDWVGQGFSFRLDSDDSCDDTTWKPSDKCKSRQRENSSQLENCEDKDTLADDDTDTGAVHLEVKKSKITITATHGIEPKPKLPPYVQRMLREDMNAKFVEFYGISCDICMTNPKEISPPVKYESFVALCDHMKSEHNVQGYVKCCNCTMRDKKRAERHMLLHTQPGSIYKCSICGKQLSTQQSFRSHIILHLPDNERPFQCSLCDRGFANKPDLTNHERQHLPVDKRLSFTCDICGSRFGSESGLSLHKQRVHGNSRPYLCDTCAKSFKSRCDMERHKAQTHGEVKREQCPECGKWFKGKSILKTHMRRHLGASFKCEHCDKTYSVRSSWKAHQLTHTDEKSHKCPVCDKAFKLPGTLKMHLNQHTGEHPYSCPFCPKTFASSGNYYTHRKRMHPNEVALLKKRQEDALLANGLPPSSEDVSEAVQSINEAVERTRKEFAAKAVQEANEKIAAKATERAKEKVSAKTTISLLDESPTSFTANRLLDDDVGTDGVSSSATILTDKGILSNTLILSSDIALQEETDVSLLVPNAVRVVRLISPKFAFARKCQDTLDLTNPSTLPVDSQIDQIDTVVTEDDDSKEGIVPPIVI